VGDSLRQNSPPASDNSPGTALAQQIEAVAFAAIPEKNGMRVEVAATGSLQPTASTQIRSLFTAPGVDPGRWAGLPANTAMVLSVHDASVFWPVLRDIFGFQTSSLGEVLGLDMESDLFGPEGPLADDVALGVTPPLPDQPISQGVTAGQLFFLARGTSQAEMDALQATMESRGAILSRQQIGEMEALTQVGTAAAGYALSFGFDDGTFLLGTSPGILAQSMTASQEGNGLVKDPVWRQVVAALPRDPALFFYLNGPGLVDLSKANMSEQEFESSQELGALTAFDAIGVGLTLEAGRIDGTIYFFLQ